MNLMLLLAQVAPALADSVAGANPVLTPIAAPDEMNLWSMAVKGGWIMVVLGVLSVVCFYILFERNYVIRKAGKEDPMFMDKIKDYIVYPGLADNAGLCGGLALAKQALKNK